MYRVGEGKAVMSEDDLNEGEALREIVMLCGESDPSDGEGISPQDCVDTVRSRLESTAPERANAIIKDILVNHLPRIIEGLEAGYVDENQILVVYDHAVRARILKEHSPKP